MLSSVRCCSLSLTCVSRYIPTILVQLQLGIISVRTKVSSISHPCPPAQGMAALSSPRPHEHKSPRFFRCDNPVSYLNNSGAQYPESPDFGLAEISGVSMECCFQGSTGQY